jgi:sensor histidine kinase YesM
MFFLYDILYLLIYWPLQHHVSVLFNTSCFSEHTTVPPHTTQDFSTTTFYILFLTLLFTPDPAHRSPAGGWPSIQLKTFFLSWVLWHKLMVETEKKSLQKYDTINIVDSWLPIGAASWWWEWLATQYTLHTFTTTFTFTSFWHSFSYYTFCLTKLSKLISVMQNFSHTYIPQNHFPHLAQRQHKEKANRIN